MILGRRVTNLLSALVFVMSFSPVAAGTSLSFDSSPVITVLSDGLRLEWFAPEPEIALNENGLAEIKVQGFELMGTPGSVVVPFKSILIAIPHEGPPELQIEEAERETVLLPAPLARAGSPQSVLGPGSRHVFSGDFIEADAGQIAAGSPITLEIIGIVRGVRLARLTFHPVLPDGDNLIITRRITAVIWFQGKVAWNPDRQTIHDPLLSTLKHIVANPEQIELIDRVESSPEPLLPDRETVAIEVSHAGVFSISYEDLAAAGYALENIDPRMLHLFHTGEEVAYRWAGDDDARFEPGEKMLFFAEPRFSRWSKYDVYFLWEDDQSGLRMDSRPADPAGLLAGDATVTIPLEQNALYTPDCFCAPIPPGRDGDRWVWDRLQYPDISTRSYPFQLHAVDTSKPASLEVWLIGFTDLVAAPDHMASITLNGVDLGVVAWNGKQAFMAEFPIPAGTLSEGENALQINLLEIPDVSVDGVWLDAFAIEYVRTPVATFGENLLFTGEAVPHAYTLSLESIADLQGYDVTDPDNPVILTGIEISGVNQVTVGDPPESGNRRYWLTTGEAVESPDRVRLVLPLPDQQNSSGGDYLIISPSDFIPALNDLITLRESQGLKVVVRDVQVIYDHFGWGVPEPTAIRNFLTFAYNSWARQPVYVLLLGDGTNDPKQYVSSSSQTFIPPYLAEVDPWAGETAADNRYVTVDGEDNLPDMLIGRLPANTLAEAQVMVNKIVDYETQGREGDWTHTALFVTDNSDSAGNFPKLSDEVLTSIPSPPFIAERHYFDPQTESPQEFREALIEAWNTGSSLIMYTGHSSIHQWAVENFIHLNDVPGLTNAQKLPVLLEMTCFTGSFQVPGFPTLDESLLRSESGGVVAAWGSSGLGIATGHRWLAKGFMGSVYNLGNANLGSATLAGRLNVAAANVYLDLIDTFNLLGDPATTLVRTYYLYVPFTRN